MSVEEDVSSAAHTAAIENIVLKKDILPEWGNGEQAVYINIHSIVVECFL